MSNFATKRNHSDGDPSDPAAGGPQWSRSEWIGELARARGDRLIGLWSEWAAGARIGRFEVLRAPEIGLVMTRGRVGAEGAAFNLGEATATRCSIRLTTASGQSVDGHAYALGRDKTKAMVSAKVDALMQTEAATGLATAILAPLRAERMAARLDVGRKAAATKVDFFTLVRGED